MIIHWDYSHHDASPGPIWTWTSNETVTSVKKGRITVSEPTVVNVVKSIVSINNSYNASPTVNNAVRANPTGITYDG